MKNKKLYKKIIVFVCLLSCLFISSVVSVGATGSTYGGDALMVPFFYPHDIYLYTSTGDRDGVLIDTNGTVPWDFTGGTYNGAYSDTEIVTYDLAGSAFYFDSNISVSHSLYSGNGYEYASGDIASVIYDLEDSTANNLRLSIRNIFLPGGFVNNSSANSFNWLGYWTVRQELGSQGYLTAERYRLRFRVVYIDSVAGGGYEVKAKEYDYDTTQSVLTSCPNVGAQIRNKLHTDLTYAQRARGVYIEYCFLQFYGIDSSQGVRVAGQSKFINENQQGFNKAFNYWQSYFGTTTVVSNQTILGSIVDGISDVWNLNLFGEFSIGALFSAVVGLSCFIWILKVFAGG